MNIAKFITNTTSLLAEAGINTARLDTLVLLCDELDCDKAWILTHDDQGLSSNQIASLQAKVNRRINREPLAYIRGRQEFYGHEFTVTPNVLIPRPETEKLIELLLDLPLPDDANVIDVGTGSGAIAISTKLARPSFNIYATDISPDALVIASKNAAWLNADVAFSQGDLLTKPPRDTFDCIISNLPYVDPAWSRSPETSHEPHQALFAADSGLELIKKLIKQSYPLLSRANHGSSYLLLEADPRQLDSLCDFAKNNGFGVQYAQDYSIALVKS